jgi:hypothetical protein
MCLFFTIALGEIIFKAEQDTITQSKKLNKNCPVIMFLEQYVPNSGIDIAFTSDMFCLLHNDPTYKNNVNIVADFIYITENIIIAKALYKLELEYHKQVKQEVYKCIKNHFGSTKKAAVFWGLTKVPKTFIEKAKFRFLGQPKIKDVNKFWQKNLSFVPPKNFFLSFKQIIFFFIDLAKDIFLIVVISR